MSNDLHGTGELETLEQKIDLVEKELDFYKSALKALPNPIFIKNQDAEFIFFNKSYEKFFGVDSQKLIGTTVEQSTYLDEKDKFRYHVEDTTLLQNKSTINYEIPFVNSTGEIEPSLYWSCGFGSTQDDTRGLIGEIVSIGNLKMVENNLLKELDTPDTKNTDAQINSNIRKQSTQFFNTILNYYKANSVLILEFDFKKGKIYSINITDTERNKNKLDIYSGISLEHIKPFIASLSKGIAKHITVSDFILEEKIKAELAYIISVIYAPLYSDNGELIGLVVVKDPKSNTDKLEILQSTIPFVIDDLQKSKVYDRLSQIRYIDETTLVFNRAKYQSVIKNIQENPPASIGILTADINGLSTINDFYGVSSGDKVLLKSATVLQEIFGNNCYRIGDDEFIVLDFEVDEIDFKNKVNRFKQEIEQSEFCNLSFGYVFAEGNYDIKQKIAYAGELMTIEKHSYYKSASNKNSKVVKYSHSLIQTLISELQNDRFAVYLQPQIDLKANKIAGAEALIRKFDIDGNLELPLSFLPLYETEKIIRHVDLFVVETVCEKISQWLKKGHMIKVSVNLSRITLMERNIIEEISHICDSYNVPHNLIELEVTETDNTIENSHLELVLKKAYDNGFGLALDDFGAEYSNLKMLTSMHFSQIKFDKSLIDNICTDIKSATIVEYAIKMCQSLGVQQLVAEGVETEQQREFLQNKNCNIGQGYLFSRPIPIDQFEKKYL